MRLGVNYTNRGLNLKDGSFMKTLAVRLFLFSFLMGTNVIVAQNSSYQQDQFIDHLLNQMTLEEKLGQLNIVSIGHDMSQQPASAALMSLVAKGSVGAIQNLVGVDNVKSLQEAAVKNSRLGIPLLFAVDMSHGYQTIFPIPLAIASAWDLQNVETMAQIAATEATSDGICWAMGPTLNVANGTWADNAGQYWSESPFMSGLIAQRMVWGYQGQSSSFSQPSQLMATPEFLGASGAEQGMTQQQMFNQYLPPFLAAVEAGAASVVASPVALNANNPLGGNWLLTDVLRNRWSFNGLIVSANGETSTTPSSAWIIDAINLGVDMMPMVESISADNINMTIINTACRRVLVAKYQLGLFNDPYRFCNPVRANHQEFTANSKREALRMATESIVLLKNDVPSQPSGKILYSHPMLPLPLKANVALIGPFANSLQGMFGQYSSAVTIENTATLLEGMQQIVDNMNNMPMNQVNQPWYLPMTGTQANIQLLYAEGCGMRSSDVNQQDLLEGAMKTADKADYIIAALGCTPDMIESGEGSVSSLSAAQQTLLQQLVATGKPVALVLFADRPINLDWANENVTAIMNVWYGGSEAAFAIGDVLFGKVSPSGKLTFDYPSTQNDGALYPFGYGQTYSKFAYGDIQMSGNSMNAQGEITLSVEVTNMGMFPANEIVQFYIQQLSGTDQNTEKQLKGWQKIYLKPGDTDIVTFTVQLNNLKFYDANLNYVAVTGAFQATIGPNSKYGPTVNFELTR